jgi:hypothetical protein
MNYDPIKGIAPKFWGKKGKPRTFEIEG